MNIDGTLFNGVSPYLLNSIKLEMIFIKSRDAITLNNEEINIFMALKTLLRGLYQAIPKAKNNRAEAITYVIRPVHTCFSYENRVMRVETSAPIKITVLLEKEAFNEEKIDSFIITILGFFFIFFNFTINALCFAFDFILCCLLIIALKKYNAPLRGKK